MTILRPMGGAVLVLSAGLGQGFAKGGNGVWRFYGMRIIPGLASAFCFILVGFTIFEPGITRFLH